MQVSWPHQSTFLLFEKLPRDDLVLILPCQNLTGTTQAFVFILVVDQPCTLIKLSSLNLKRPYQSCSTGLRSNLLLAEDKSIVFLVLSSFPPLLSMLHYTPFFSAKNYLNQGFPGGPVHSFISDFVISINYTSGRFIGLYHFELSNPPIIPRSNPIRNGTMIKASTRSRSAKTQLGGGGVRGRDVEFPSAPIHVTGDAQAKVIDINTARQFEFSRMERNKLPERPSTSGGPAANLSMRRNAEKRETKDDLHFNPLAAHGSGTTFYNFPLPGSLPTQSNTPRTSPPIRTSSLPRSDTPDSMEAMPTHLNVPQMEIGMALGSPTHQPTDWQSQVPVVSSARNGTPDSVDTYVDNDAYVGAPSKQKASKWKIFGGLFGGSKKNQGGSPQAFYQLQPEGAVAQATGEADYANFGEPVSSSEPKPPKSRGRGRTNSQQKAEKYKPDMKRAQTVPLNFDFQDSSRGRIMTGTPEITLDGGPLDVHPGQKYAHGGPLLDVDIPSIEMERYSIMFGSLLQKPTGTSSSLLARRQATLDRLKTVNEALALKVSPRHELFVDAIL